MSLRSFVQQIKRRYPVIDAGDYVEITGGFDQDTFSPIPAFMVGAKGVVFETGRMIDMFVEPGSSWGTYTEHELSEPVPELRVRVVLPPDHADEDVGIDGLLLRKLSALEALALQADS